MLTAVSVATMRQVDQRAKEEFGLLPIQLMENAGRTIAEFVIKYFHAPQMVSLLIGKGHNGGDGLVAARHLHSRGIEVEIVLADENVRNLTAQQLYTIREIGIAEVEFPSEETDLVVDCLLGYGANGSPDERIADLLIVANALGVPKLAIDFPTGFEPKSGFWSTPCFANATVLTLALPKEHMQDNARIKEVFVGDIGIPTELYERMGITDIPLFANTSYVRVS